MTEAAAAMQRLDDDLVRYDAALGINKYDLDNAMIDHPGFLNRVGQRHADAISYRDEAKDDLEGTKARVDSELRFQHTERGEKFTEKSIDGETLAHPDVQRALGWHRAWNDRVNRWRSMWESACSRTEMLKGLCHMYNAGYWADQTKIGASREARAEAAAETAAGIVGKERPPRRKLGDATT